MPEHKHGDDFHAEPVSEELRAVRICADCGHPEHGTGIECTSGVNHDGGKSFHRCLCLARSGARHTCPPLMTCGGGDLGYADLYYLQQGHSLVRAGRVITPDDLLPPTGRDRLVGYRAAFSETVLRCLDPVHRPDACGLASGRWWGVTAAQVAASDLRCTCSWTGCGIDVLAGRHLPTTPCDEDMPCNWEDSGEPCERHEREQAHAEGDHALCEADITCETAYSSEMLRNTILYSAIPGSKAMLRELERRAAAVPKAAVPE